MRKCSRCTMTKYTNIYCINCLRYICSSCWNSKEAHQRKRKNRATMVHKKSQSNIGQAIEGLRKQVDNVTRVHNEIKQFREAQVLNSPDSLPINEDDLKILASQCKTGKMECLRLKTVLIRSLSDKENIEPNIIIITLSNCTSYHPMS